MDLFMILFLCVFLLVIFYKIKIGKNIENDFTDKEQSNVLRGICCIIVVLVHIPANHGNFIQDAIGSFGYIAVTIFFLLSAYGLKYSLDNKKKYLKHFLRNRLLIIYIPFVIANLLYQLIVMKSEFDILKIVGIKNITFVGELMLFYLIFYVIYKNIKDIHKADIVMIGFGIIISIISYLFKFGWYVECLGFIYGIIIYKLQNKFNNIINKNYIFNLVFFTLLSLVLGIIYIRVKNIEMVNYIIKVILGISLICLIAIILKRIKIYNKLLKKLGKISYEVFLLHIIIIHVFEKIDITSGVYISLVIITTILCAYLMNKLDIKIANGLKYKKS